jgi:hypothetical protein
MGDCNNGERYQRGRKRNAGEQQVWMRKRNRDDDRPNRSAERADQARTSATHRRSRASPGAVRRRPNVETLSRLSDQRPSEHAMRKDARRRKCLAYAPAFCQTLVGHGADNRHASTISDTPASANYLHSPPREYKSPDIRPPACFSHDWPAAANGRAKLPVDWFRSRCRKKIQLKPNTS